MYQENGYRLLFRVQNTPQSSSLLHQSPSVLEESVGAVAESD